MSNMRSYMGSIILVLWVLSCIITQNARAEEPIVQGCLDKSLIQRVIDGNSEKIKACYEKGLTTDPSLKGKIVIKFMISADGTVGKAQIKTSDMNSEIVEDCLVERFEEMKFQTPTGSTVFVTYPFLFKPSADEESEEEKDEE